MENSRKEYESDVHTRIAGAKNTMLAMAAPLESSPSSSQKSKPIPLPEVKKAEIKDTNQKAGLLVGLLVVGALEPAVALLSKFPWLVDVRTEIADLLIRILIRIPSNHQGAESQLCASKGTRWVIRNQLSSSSQTYPNSLGSHSTEYTYHRLCFLLSRLGRPYSSQYLTRRPGERN